jgi:hypothetical protein
MSRYRGGFRDDIAISSRPLVAAISRYFLAQIDGIGDGGLEAWPDCEFYPHNNNTVKLNK